MVRGAWGEGMAVPNLGSPFEESPRKGLASLGLVCRSCAHLVLRQAEADLHLAQADFPT